MTSAITRRIPRPFSVLTALAALALSTPLALVGAPGHAAPAADESSVSFKGSMDIVVRSDDTYSLKVEMTTSSEIPLEDSCTEEAFKTPGAKSVKDLKVNFKEEGDTATCTAEGSAKVSESKGEVTHKNGEYIVETPDFGIGSSDNENISFSQSVTFPGKVTEADGGEVKGNKVTFTDGSAHTVKGKDGAIPMWVWILVGVGALALVGGLAAFFILRGKKNKAQAPYGVPGQGYDPNQALPTQPGQGYDPNQAFPAQPGQQAGYGAPQAQPGQQTGYGAPQAQPDQQTGYGAPQAQPDQQTGYGAPQAQPGQPPYGNGQPGQGTY